MKLFKWHWMMPRQSDTIRVEEWVKSEENSRTQEQSSVEQAWWQEQPTCKSWEYNTEGIGVPVREPDDVKFLQKRMAIHLETSRMTERERDLVFQWGRDPNWVQSMQTSRRVRRDHNKREERWLQRNTEMTCKREWSYVCQWFTRGWLYITGRQERKVEVLMIYQEESVIMDSTRTQHSQEEDHMLW